MTIIKDNKLDQGYRTSSLDWVQGVYNNGWDLLKPDVTDTVYHLLTFEGVTNWNQIMAAAMVLVVPILLLFTLFQRYFIQGVTLTGMKC